MTTVNQRRISSVILVAVVFLIGCKGHDRSGSSVLSHEIDEVRRRSVPNSGSLLRVSQPIRSDSSVRATWEVQAGSDNRTYLQWLKNQLGPDYHVTSQTTSALTFVKQTDGDVYTLQMRTGGVASNPVFEANFVAEPD